MRIKLNRKKTKVVMGKTVINYEGEILEVDEYLFGAGTKPKLRSRK